jgi:hypothetical protein
VIFKKYFAIEIITKNIKMLHIQEILLFKGQCHGILATHYSS